MLYIAATVAAITNKKAQYIKNRPFDDAHYRKMVLDYVKRFGYATRRDIDNLLMDKLSDVLSEKQKKNKIRNLIAVLSRKEKSIRERRFRQKTTLGTCSVERENSLSSKKRYISSKIRCNLLQQVNYKELFIFQVLENRWKTTDRSAFEILVLEDTG